MTDETNISRRSRSLSASLAWFVALYVGGVTAVAALAFVFRLLFLNAVR